MKMPREKFRSGCGFTLVEMLIVVAVVAILVAISIPMINTSLEHARDAADRANERAAKAEAVMLYLDVGDEDDELKRELREHYVYYDAASGKLVLPSKDHPVTPYGKCTKEHPGEHLFMSVIHVADTNQEDEGDHVNKFLMVFLQDGQIQLTWWK